MVRVASYSDYQVESWHDEQPLIEIPGRGDHHIRCRALTDGHEPPEVPAVRRVTAECARARSVDPVDSDCIGVTPSRLPAVIEMNELLCALCVLRGSIFDRH